MAGYALGSFGVKTRARILRKSETRFVEIIAPRDVEYLLAARISYQFEVY